MQWLTAAERRKVTKAGTAVVTNKGIVVARMKEITRMKEVTTAAMATVVFIAFRLHPVLRVPV